MTLFLTILPQLHLIPHLQRFPNKELFLEISREVKGKECLITASLSPPEVHFFALLTLIHLLKKEKAKTIIALIPYLAYARHDHNIQNQSWILPLIGDLLKAAGLRFLFTIDLHNPAHTHFPFPVVSLSPAPLFISKIRQLKWTKATVIAPDEGARKRAFSVAEALDLPLLVLPKTRTKKSVIHHKIKAQFSKRAILIDDILDTGKTLLSCCAALRKEGVEEILIFVTHGLFTHKTWEKLWTLGVKRIYCTDTVPLPSRLSQDSRITVLSTKKLQKEALRKKPWKKTS